MFSSGPLRVRLVQFIATLGEEKKNLVAQTECSLGFENREKKCIAFPKTRLFTLFDGRLVALLGIALQYTEFISIN